MHRSWNAQVREIGMPNGTRKGNEAKYVRRRREGQGRVDERKSSNAAKMLALRVYDIINLSIFMSCRYKLIQIESSTVSSGWVRYADVAAITDSWLRRRKKTNAFCAYAFILVLCLIVSAFLALCHSECEWDFFPIHFQRSDYVGIRPTQCYRMRVRLQVAECFSVKIVTDSTPNCWMDVFSILLLPPPLMLVHFFSVILSSRRTQQTFFSFFIHLSVPMRLLSALPCIDFFCGLTKTSHSCSWGAHVRFDEWKWSCCVRIHFI